MPSAVGRCASASVISRAGAHVKRTKERTNGDRRNTAGRSRDTAAGAPSATCRAAGFRPAHIGPDKRRHTAPTTFTVRTVAEGWLATERRLSESGDWTSPAARAKQQETAGRTLADYADAWLEHRNIKERTRVHYRALLDAHIQPDLGDVPLRQLTAADVRAWYATTALGKPTLRSHAYGLLHAICATALEDGDMLANPCRIKGAGSTPASGCRRS